MAKPILSELRIFDGSYTLLPRLQVKQDDGVLCSGSHGSGDAGIGACLFRIGTVLVEAVTWTFCVIIRANRN